ncbi:SusC/RagA family TonB-linked outer membrane protein [Chitinophaga sp. SYP-B3965]|nr:SusC/RagA family TonB-linked outer membrane protein [Chitinophaga sp. SYP-B3965]
MQKNVYCNQPVTELHAPYHKGWASTRILLVMRLITGRSHPANRRLILNAMKLTIIFLTAACLQLSANSKAQSVTFTGNKVALEKVIAAAEKQTGYFFFYNEAILRNIEPVTVKATDMPLDLFLKEVFKKLPLDYTVRGKQIVISKKALLPVDGPAGRQLEEAPVVVPAYQVINGVVVSADFTPLSGASVRLKNSKEGTQTDLRGRFSINANAGDILVISYIGYEDKEVTLANNTLTTYIILKPSESKLDEVQITAYGQTTKRMSIGNIYTVKGEDIARNPTPNVLQALQGRVPGMFIQQQSGQPGTPISVQIRGRSTLNGNSAPLFIVDGVAYPTEALPFIFVNGQPNILRGGNVFDYINPEVVDRVEVLKDADATSIYGSRGAYGVVLITTKKGKPGNPQLSVNVRSGITLKGKSPELLNTEEYLMLRREAMKNNNNAQPTAADYDLNGTWPETRYTNWLNELQGGKAQYTSTNVSYSGGTNNINFLVGGNYNVQESIQRGAGASKQGGLNFNINTITNNRRFSINLSGLYSITQNDMLQVDFTTNSTLSALAPNAAPLFLPNGEINWAPDALSNPLGSAGTSIVSPFKMISKHTTNNITTNLDFKYELAKGLSIRALVGYNSLYGRQLYGNPSTYYNPQSAYITTSTLNLFNVRTWTLDPNINYITKLGYQGTLTARAGATLMDKVNYAQATTGNDFISDAMLYNPTFAAPANISTSYNQIPSRYLGYFGLLRYDWANKYFVNLSVRYDGSTKFGPNKQFGTFGSVGAGWIVSDERFFKALLPVVSFAKISGSYGTSGGDGISNYQFMNTYFQGTAYGGSPGLRPGVLANPELQWEQNLKRDIGLNLEFLKGGPISLDVSYYSNLTKNQLIPQPLSSITGYSTITRNSPALIRSTGLEMVLSTTNIKKKNFSWTTTINFSVPKNILVSYPQSEKLFDYAIKEGQSTNGQPMFKYAGIDPQTGAHTFYKNGVKGEWTILSGGALDQIKDRTEFVDFAPKFYGGMQNTLKYKGITLDFFLVYTSRLGPTYLGMQTYPFGIFMGNTTRDILRRWQKPGDVTDIPKLSSSFLSYLGQVNYHFSTGAYTKANYLRLNNLNISYAFPAALLKRAHIKGASIFLQGQNLLTISKYGDLDPENLGAGMAPLRVFTGGISMNL